MTALRPAAWLPVAVGALLWATPAEAQRPPPPVTFQHYSVDQGLPQSTGTAILEDRHGFLWVGTQDGLARFDGHDFETFVHDPSDSGSLPGAEVTVLAETADGSLWVGTAEGLARLPPAPAEVSGASHSEGAIRPSFQVWRHREDDPASISSSDVRALAADGAGRLWVGTALGLDRIDLLSATVGARSLVPGLPDGPGSAVNSLHVDASGRLWVGGAGLWVVSAGEGAARRVRLTADDVPIRSVGSLDSNAGGSVWAATDVGVVRVDPRTLVATLLPDGVQRALGNVGRLVVDASGTVWIGGSGGVYEYDRHSGHLRSHRHEPTRPESLPPGGVMALYQDRSGILWVGTGRGGVSKLVRGRRFSHLAFDPADPEGGLSSPYITGIAEGKAGVLWIGTGGGGLNEYHRSSGRVRVLGVPGADAPDGAADYVFDVLEDAHGTVWASTDAGLLRLPPGSRAMEPAAPEAGATGPASRTGSGLHESAGGWIWTAFLYRDGWALHRVTIDGAAYAFGPAVPMGAELGAGAVQALIEDRSGRVWAGTMGAGLVVTDTAGRTRRRLVHVDGDATSLPNDVVQVIHEDRKGRIWVGTRGGGLSLYVLGSGGFRHYRTGDGLANNVVYGIVEADGGDLWLSTNRGLSRFDPEESRFFNYDVSDGLQSNEFNRWAFEKTGDGLLVFGGMNGVNLIDPGALGGSAVPAKASLRGAYVRNRPVTVGVAAASLTRLELDHDENVVSFDVASLHFVNPVRNRIRYRLEGLDDTWTEAGPRAVARYANLAPGLYLFRASAANSDGVWQEDGLALAISVRPPFWRTWWFLALSGLAALGLLLAAHRVRLRAVLAEERTRTLIARDLHDDVSATLSGISYFAHALASDTARAEPRTRRHYLSLIRESAADARERIGDIVWAISPEHDEWTAVLPKLRRYASDLCAAHGIEHRIDMPEALALPPLGAERRQHLWLFYKEALANVVRHAGARRVDLTLGAEGRLLRLVIADDGSGFAEGAGGAGHGIGNLRARARALGGELSLDTAPGRGTRWTLSFRARR